MLTARIGFDKLSKIEVDIYIQLEIKLKVIPLLPGGATLSSKVNRGGHLVTQVVPLLDA
jgi:hypothetical protein